MLLIVLISCDNELDPIVKGPPLPVVYALLDAEDSVAKVRLSKTFILEEGFETETVPRDSIMFPDARVWLERWNGDYLYLRSELSREDLARKPGLFPTFPNPIYYLPLNDETARIFEPPKYKELDLIKLIVEIPGFPLIYSQIKPLSSPHIIAPRSGSRVTLFGEEGLRPKWSSSPQAYYTEGYIGIEYTDFFADSDSTRHVQWREYHADASMLNPSPFIIYGEDFLKRTAFYVGTNPMVRYRKLIRIWITIYCTDENFYDYLTRSNVTPIDQTGLPYSNLVNAIGIFSATATTKKWFLPDYYTLDRLSNSDETKHLRFVEW